MSIAEDEEFNSTLSYTPPSWSAVPKQPLYVDVIREGAIIQYYKLCDKSFYLIGSSQLEVDILYENPVISKIHAVIQFNEEGKAFLMDLNSNSGTWKGAERIKPMSYVQLYASDRITFGSQRANRAFVIRAAGEVDYPLEVRKEKSERQTAKQIFDKEGKLIKSALEVLESRQKIYEAKQTNPESETTKENVLHKYFDKEKGFFNIRLFRQSKHHALLNAEQLEILKKIHSLQSAETKTSRDEDDSEFNKDSSQSFSAAPKLSTETAFQLTELVQELVYSLEDEEFQMLSETTKQALDDRLFDEDDAFFDRTSEETSSPSASNQTYSKLHNQLKDLESEICEKEETLLKMRTEQEDTSQSKDDILDVFMKQNQLNLEASHLNTLKDRKTAINRALGELVSNETKKSAKISKRVANKAVSTASELMAKIAKEHESAGKRRRAEIKLRITDEEEEDDDEED